MAAECDTFSYSRKTDLNTSNITWPINNDKFQLSKFDEFLREKWKSAMANGYFRYNLDEVKTKVIPGKYKYVAQVVPRVQGAFCVCYAGHIRHGFVFVLCISIGMSYEKFVTLVYWSVSLSSLLGMQLSVKLNVRRATERRAPVAFSSVKESFKAEKFHFMKINSNEILFQLHPKENLPDIENSQVKYKAKHSIIINVSPIELGHILLLPFVEDCLPQILTVSSLALAFDMVLLSTHRGFRIGWNSLGGFASVNHLHFHAIYLDHPILAEHMEVSPICNGLYEPINIKSRGFAFQLDDHSCTDQLARLVYKVTSYFSNNELAHNLMITRGNSFQNPNKTTLRVLLWAAQPNYGLCDECFNCAIVEKAGHIPIKDPEEYDSMTEEKANIVFEKFSLSETEFNALKVNLTDLLIGGR